jgi:hypothetical protein
MLYFSIFLNRFSVPGHTFSYCCNGVRLWLCGHAPLMGSLSILQMIHKWIWRSSGMIWTGGKLKDVETCLSATSPTWTALGANHGHILHSPTQQIIPGTLHIIWGGGECLHKFCSFSYVSVKTYNHAPKLHILENGTHKLHKAHWFQQAHSVLAVNLQTLKSLATFQDFVP